MSTIRLPAEERRASLLDAACRLFAGRSYRGTTTADLARAAGVTEPVLYRHFPSKRALYLACMDWSWEEVQELWAEPLAAEPDPGLWLSAMRAGVRRVGGRAAAHSPLWVQALAESSDDPEIARLHARRTCARCTNTWRDVIRRAQEAGGVPPERDPDAEAWIFIALGLLTMADEVVGALLQDTWPAIRREPDRLASRPRFRPSRRCPLEG